MTGTSSRRVAILGLMLESNRFAPVTTEEDYLNRVYLAGTEILEDLNLPDPKLPTEIRGFIGAMNAHCDWTAVPILVGLVEAGGPLEHAFYQATRDEMKRRLEAAMPLDAVYIANHGAMVTTEEDDPDGELFAMVRSIVGPEVPIVATLDLHGNVSERMVESADAIVAYRTNPHVDMRARGMEAAGILLEMFTGMRPEMAFIRLPLIPPTVTLLTESGPYADIIEYGQGLITDEIANVSILGGFAFGDTPKNGMAILVTARHGGGVARAVARLIAQKAWDDHERYVPHLASLEDAVARVVEAGRHTDLPALILADVADNPGGGGRGNTMWILEALHDANVTGVMVGVIHDPALAHEAHARGEGATFQAIFNRHEPDEFSRRFEATARVACLKDGECVGRRGFYAGRHMNLGPSALLVLGGIQVVVISIRTQCADPVFLEMMGLDIARARAVVVKSRGHFRAGFDEFFSADQVIEVDTPGLTSPILSRFDFRHLPRPAFPIDSRVDWTLPG
ncbi:M81 family metallopeptidase [Halomonas heilongjiangensis]|uniref:Microcystinase C n=1 Tax=Halomonas heilongjiangensis TaxID=1387883 RepID=A0A2N7TVF5_9GAMM|nr:M81 family metallopeptidase [Halomonas heilongjiangensis]PMR72181.1 MlrC family protein 3 [Halomonas heilongjiangensis]PXX91432.1 MlrC family protein 3 [Halomonas heilongjiangensis]